MQQHAYFMFPYMFNYFTYAVTNLRDNVFHSFFSVFSHNIIIIIDRKVIRLRKVLEQFATFILTD